MATTNNTQYKYKYGKTQRNKGTHRNKTAKIKSQTKAAKAENGK